MTDATIAAASNSSAPPVRLAAEVLKVLISTNQQTEDVVRLIDFVIELLIYGLFALVLLSGLVCLAFCWVIRRARANERRTKQSKAKWTLVEETQVRYFNYQLGRLNGQIGQISLLVFWLILLFTVLLLTSLGLLLVCLREQWREYRRLNTRSATGKGPFEMSLDAILHSIDNLLVDVSANVNRLLQTLIWFLPIFIVAFTVLVFLLLIVAISALVLQCKRNRQLSRTQRATAVDDPVRSPPLLKPTSLKVETTNEY